MTLFEKLSEVRLYISNYWVSHIPSHTIRLWFYRRVMKFEIGKGSTILMGCTFDCAGGLIMGKDSVINSNCRIDLRGTVKIGDNVSISNETTILTADHDMDSPGMDGRKFPMEIGDCCWIGTRAMILPGVKIGTGAVVAAGAVVTKDVNPFEVVAGVPAKVIKIRKCQSGFTYTSSYLRFLQ
jgi:acetyltransferase-like isoleucine patch superfamily enzyme